MLIIRKANSDDIPLILEFIRELAEYEHLLDQAVATAAGDLQARRILRRPQILRGDCRVEG